MIEYEIVVPLYGIRVDVVVSEDMNNNREYLISRYGDLGFDMDSSVGYSCVLKIPNEGKRRYLLLDLNDKNLEKINNVVSHECLHLSWSICQELGINLTADNHEAQGYYI
jgi:imidazoleglycerol phosphate dehydratase HisB